MDRTSIVAALTLVASACFYDHAPTTGGPTTTQDASTGTTAAAPTTGVVTTSDDTTGTTGASGSASEAAGTTVDPTTGVASDPTTTAMDPSTTQPMNATTGDPSTGGARDECSGKAVIACYQCCAAAEPGSQVFVDGLAACACPEKQPCAGACSDSLCKGLFPADTCLGCIGMMADMACLQQANTACQSDPACGEFVACVNDSNCTGGL